MLPGSWVGFCVRFEVIGRLLHPYNRQTLSEQPLEDISQIMAKLDRTLLAILDLVHSVWYGYPVPLPIP